MRNDQAMLLLIGTVSQAMAIEKGTTNEMSIKECREREVHEHNV